MGDDPQFEQVKAMLRQQFADKRDEDEIEQLAHEFVGRLDINSLLRAIKAVHNQTVQPDSKGEPKAVHPLHLVLLHERERIIKAVVTEWRQITEVREPEPFPWRDDIVFDAYWQIVWGNEDVDYHRSHQID